MCAVLRASSANEWCVFVVCPADFLQRGDNVKASLSSLRLFLLQTAARRCRSRAAKSSLRVLSAAAIVVGLHSAIGAGHVCVWHLLGLYHIVPG